MTGILLVDKEQGWTSSDVVAKLRGVLREKKVGHAGTLDPLATGLLIVMIGRASRASDFLMRHDKSYRATLRLGIETDTQDISGHVLSEKPCRVTAEELADLLPSFLGEQQQIPPMYSAIKMHGLKLYEIARKGETVERAPRTIRISSIAVKGFEGQDPILEITCSAGTYIRTLCHDIGRALGCGGCMAGLRRLSSGTYSVKDAFTIHEIEAAAEAGAAEELLLPVDSVFSELRALTVDEVRERKLRCGNPVPVSCPDGPVRVYSESGAFLLLGNVRGGVLKTEKSFFEVPV